jgi:hypothetical protein
VSGIFRVRFWVFVLGALNEKTIFPPRTIRTVAICGTALDVRGEKVTSMVASIAGGSMPPWFYPILHPRANLSKAEQQQLIAGLAATFRNSPPKGGG